MRSAGTAVPIRQAVLARVFVRVRVPASVIIRVVAALCALLPIPALAAPHKPPPKPAPTAAPPALPVDPAEQAAKALLAIVDADPLELNRVVQRFGDGAILELLAPPTPILTQLAAVRASPWLRAPERALGALTELAAGRDPELAPAAARAALEIARQLDGASLARRECAPDELLDVLVRLQAIGARETVAPHVRAYAWAAAEQLIAAGVSPPPSK
jgi:hypothetical protein